MLKLRPWKISRLVAHSTNAVKLQTIKLSIILYCYRVGFGEQNNRSEREYNNVSNVYKSVVDLSDSLYREIMILLHLTWWLLQNRCYMQVHLSVCHMYLFVKLTHMPLNWHHLIFLFIGTVIFTNVVNSFFARDKYGGVFFNGQICAKVTFWSRKMYLVAF